MFELFFSNILIFSFSYFDKLIDDYSFHIDRGCSSVLHVCNNLSDTVGKIPLYRDGIVQASGSGNFCAGH